MSEPRQLNLDKNLVLAISRDGEPIVIMDLQALYAYAKWGGGHLVEPINGFSVGVHLEDWKE